MIRRSKAWLVVGVLFFFINFAGGIFAAVQGEVLHAGVHAALLVVGYYYARRIWRRGGLAIPAGSREVADSLTHLEQSLEAVGFAGELAAVVDDEARL